VSRRPARRTPAPGPAGPAAGHRADAARGLPAARGAVLTVSDTRGRDSDPSGDLLAAGLATAGVVVGRRAWVLDESGAIESALRALLADGFDVVLVTGGTGPGRRDVTPEAVRAIGGRELPGFGELFRMLSYLEIGSAAVLSRALCTLHGRQVVYALPGSTAACGLALERLILPELDHLRAQLERSAGPPS